MYMTVLCHTSMCYNSEKPQLVQNAQHRHKVKGAAITHRREQIQPARSLWQPARSLLKRCVFHARSKAKAILRQRNGFCSILPLRTCSSSSSSSTVRIGYSVVVYKNILLTRMNTHFFIIITHILCVYLFLQAVLSHSTIYRP